MKYTVSDDNLKSVADAIRTKGSTSADLVFPDGFVSAIGNIQTGGGSTLITKSITANGTYNASSDSADGYSSVTVAVPSRTVIGTFTGSDAEKGTAKTLSIPYTGTGYPIAAMVFPSVGANKSGSTYASAVQRYAIDVYTLVKNNIGTAPNYSGNTEANQTTVNTCYKNSDSDAATYTRTGSMTYNQFRSAAATAGGADALRFHSSTSMSVFIASTSYGFMAGVEYTYQIVYSS